MYLETVKEKRNVLVENKNEKNEITLKLGELLPT